jgi:hypothetical protein
VEQETATVADSPLPVWQSALLSRGCEVRAESQFFPLELRPAGDRLVCTPSVSGFLMPFNVSVTIGEPVAITWDTELSRYIVNGSGETVAA